MKQIWKWPLELTRDQTIAAPAGTRLLAVGDQGGRLMVWGEVVVDHADRVRIDLAIYGTGHALPDNPGRYLGTVLQGAFVWHVYDASGLR